MRLGKHLGVLGAVVVIAACITSVSGATYSDSTGDLSSGSPNLSVFTHLDIASVEVTDNGTDLSFAITLVGDIVATDWGKYMIGINTGAGGDTAGNGWGRPISMNPGMDYWIGTWVDSGNGAELRSWNGAAWQLDLATYNPPPGDINMSKTQFTATVSVPLASMGLGAGDSIDFDVYSSGGGGGDGPVDALSSSTPSITDWGNAYSSPGNTGLRTYTVVPEPTALAALCIGALGIGLRRRR